MSAGTKASELRELGNEELVGKLREAKEELFNLRFQAATGQLENHGRLKAVRKRHRPDLHPDARARARYRDGGERLMSESNVTEQQKTERNARKTREGYVVSDKMDKTVVVAVEDRVKHALYGKVIRRTNKLKAHDEQNAAGVGDRVLLMETRKLSATKHWRVVEILEKARVECGGTASWTTRRAVPRKPRWGTPQHLVPPGSAEGLGDQPPAANRQTIRR